MGIVPSSIGRSIPACAGEPLSLASSALPGRVYPRVCGGTLWEYEGARGQIGLSPRVRGNRVQRRTAQVELRSIPACAGEPVCGFIGIHMGRVYPRVCGGTRHLRRRLPSAQGLSPRVRGNHPDQSDHVRYQGSIPACAGEPSSRRSRGGAGRVYPRVCGGTVVGTLFRGATQGLSPRVRGNRHGGGVLAMIDRSIPACAGEP